MNHQKDIQDLSKTNSINSYILPSNKDLSNNNKENNKNSYKLGKKRTRQNILNKLL
jgi:hypothetical protein